MGGGKMRTATINRTTAETDISLTLDLDPRMKVADYVLHHQVLIR